MSTAFIIRFHYDRWDEAVVWRYHWFRLMVLPRIQKVRGEFDVCVWCKEDHAPAFEEAGCKTFRAKPTGQTSPDRINLFDFIEPLDLGRYDLQVAIDSDDLILRADFLGHIWHYCHASKSTHVSFQWRAFDVSSLKLYKCPYQYSAEKGSAVFAVHQPHAMSRKRYAFCYEDSHIVMPRKLDIRHFEPDDSFCAVAVHNYNDSTRIATDAEPIR